ncbi:MAG TPA: hypothetical protein VE398_03355, partial [Acidobacteriota bacterium]|nr:hypothetical protein [Acidobacteriota bacterium]
DRGEKDSPMHPGKPASRVDEASLLWLVVLSPCSSAKDLKPEATTIEVRRNFRNLRPLLSPHVELSVDARRYDLWCTTASSRFHASRRNQAPADSSLPQFMTVDYVRVYQKIP